MNSANIATRATHVVAAIIWEPDNSGRFLISKRQKGKHLQDHWELPGGKTESDETPAQALSRELDEELGIEVIQSAPFMQVNHAYSDRTIFLDVWVVSEFGGRASSREQQELAWIGPDQIDDFLFPQADRPVLDAIKSSAKAGN